MAVKRHTVSDENYTKCTLDHNDYLLLHTHNYWEFMLILNGTMYHKINGKLLRLERNTLCVIRPDDKHMLKRASFETSHINFITSSDLMKKLLDIYSPDLYGQLLLSDEIYFPISESASKNYQSAAIRLLSTPANDPLFHYRKMDMLLNFIQNLTRHCANPATNAQPYPEHVVKIMQAIWKKENAHKTLSEILENMGYSYVQLSRIFKQYTQTTLSKYFIRSKMNQARILLESTDMKIIDIATEVGYSSLAHFQVVFKNFYGVTPSQFRRRWINLYSAMEDAD